MSAKNILIGTLFLSLVFISGCGLTGDSKEDDKDVLETLRSEILQIIGDGSCNGSDDCRCIGFGSKPCGGPWSYLVYSAQNTDTLSLILKVTIYNTKEDAYNKKWGIASDCMFVPPPDTLVCENGKCVGYYFYDY